MLDGLLSYALRRPVLGRNACLALFVGTVLVTVNLSGRIAEEGWTRELALRTAFNYLIPFLVSTLSAAVNRPPAQK